MVGTVVAPVWFDASAMGDDQAARELLDRDSQGLPDRQVAARAGGSAVRRRPHRFGVVAGRLGQGPGGKPEEDRRDVQAGRGDRPRLRRKAGCRGRNLLGRNAFLADDGRPARAGRRARDCRLSGRHGTHAALHARRKRARRSDLARGLRLERPRDPRRGPEEVDRRAAALDDRLPRRPERRDRLRLGHSRPHRPALPGKRPERQAGYPPPRRLLAPRRKRQADQDESATSAGTAACFPMRS